MSAERTYDHQFVVCPHCQYKHGDAFEICHSEDLKEHECDGCGKVFLCRADYSVAYIAIPKDESL
jgi:hypothetical protein